MEDRSRWSRVSCEEIREFVSRALKAVDVRAPDADLLAQLLMEADYRGFYSHGLNRLHNYVNEVRGKFACLEGEPIILKEQAATAWVDGKDLLGPTVGKYCMELAIKKACEVGVGMVCVKNSNHFGITGWYSQLAMDAGMIGMAFTNTSPVVFPTRSRAAALGTNPIAFGAKGEKDDTFLLDMATSPVALGKVEMCSRTGKPIPDGWGCDGNGKQVNDPEAVLEGGGLFPLGGCEEAGGYKGYGLAMMVEILCGILVGANYSTNVQFWATQTASMGLGQCFVAINPAVFAPGFSGRVQDLMDTCRNSEPADPSLPVQVAGDPERAYKAFCDELGGIPYHKNQIDYIHHWAAELNIAPPKIINPQT